MLRTYQHSAKIARSLIHGAREERLRSATGFSCGPSASSLTIGDGEGSGPSRRRTEAAMLIAMNLDEAMRTRRSVRGFLPKPVPNETLREVFELAQHAPSNCNVQPWRVFVASGAVRDELSRRLVEATKQSIARGGEGLRVFRFEGDYRRLQIECAVELYEKMGVARDDQEGRVRGILRNYELFDAPHVAIVCMEKRFDIGVALDVGMYMQNLLLALWSRGIAACPQAALTAHEEISRELLGIPDNLQLLCGISFGYEDKDVPANRTRQKREPIDRNVFFVG